MLYVVLRRFMYKDVIDIRISARIRIRKHIDKSVCLVLGIVATIQR